MIEVAKDSSLKSRIIRSSAICVHNPLMPSRPKEYKKWDEMQLQKVCQDVRYSSNATSHSRASCSRVTGFSRSSVEAYNTSSSHHSNRQ